MINKNEYESLCNIFTIIHRKVEETLEFKLNKSMQTFHFNPPVDVKEDWMIGLLSLEVYNSIFNITEENNKLKLYKFPDEKSGGVSYEKIRDETEKDMDISDITASDLQNEIIGPFVIKEYRDHVTKRLEDVGYMKILAGYHSFVF